ncbi:hypothetical protein BDZ88DRAFT_106271 [Geranomyces variabilis]|nr:hypothetical protein BDZ88DRAFT_106271 [Geranomyces variabilis]
MPRQSELLVSPSATSQDGRKHAGDVTATTSVPDSSSQWKEKNAQSRNPPCNDDDGLDTITQQKEQYRDHMTPREYAYFDTFSVEHRRDILVEAKDNLQTQNVEKIKAKTFGMEFLGNVSHELRTPLNGLIGVIDLMQSEEMSTSQRLYIKTLEQSCTHLLSVALPSPCST